MNNQSYKKNFINYFKNIFSFDYVDKRSSNSIFWISWMIIVINISKWLFNNYRETIGLPLEEIIGDGLHRWFMVIFITMVLVILPIIFADLIEKIYEKITS